MFIEINHIPILGDLSQTCYNEFDYKLFEQYYQNLDTSIVNISTILMISKSLACVENKEPVGVAEICTTSGLLFTTHEELNRIENILLDAGLLRKN